MPETIGGLRERFLGLKFGFCGHVLLVLKTRSISEQNCTPATLKFGFHGQCWIGEEPRPLTAFIALLSFGMVDIVQKDQVWIKKEQSARSDFCFLPNFYASYRFLTVNFAVQTG